MSATAPKKARAAKRSATPSKEAPKSKRGDGQRVSTPTFYESRSNLI